MIRNRRVWFPLTIAALAACRSVPFYGGPGFDPQRESIDGTLGRKMEANLTDDGNHNAAGFRYEIPGPGSLIATAKPVHPQAKVSIDVYAQGSGNEPIAKGEPGKKVEAPDLQPGTYYVVVRQPWKETINSRVSLLTVFKPQDAEAQGPCKSQATARPLRAGESAEGEVDYSAQRRTCWWKVALDAGGTLRMKFDNRGQNLTAEFVPPQGAPEKIDPVAGLEKKDLVSGEYYVKVFANDAGDAGRYTVSSSFKEGDVCQNGGPACSIEGAEELKVPSDSKSADVDYGKAKAFHFYKLAVKDKGRLTINFKVTNPSHGSKVAAYFMRAQDDEGERIAGSSAAREIEQPGDYWIRVQAMQGDAGKYTLATYFLASNYILAEVVEIGRNPCMLTVNAGADQSVKAGAACTVVTAQGQPIDGCQVDQVFPKLSKVRPVNPACRIGPTSKVQISPQ